MCKSLSQLGASDETNTEIILSVDSAEDWIWKWVPQKKEQRRNSEVTQRQQLQEHTTCRGWGRRGRRGTQSWAPSCKGWAASSRRWCPSSLLLNPGLHLDPSGRAHPVPATVVTGVRRDPIGAVFGAVFLSLHSRVCIVWLLSFHSTNI